MARDLSTPGPLLSRPNTRTALVQSPHDGHALTRHPLHGVYRIGTAQEGVQRDGLCLQIDRAHDQQALAGAQAQLGALAQQAAGQAALDAVAGKQGPKGDPGASGTVATYTTTASAVHSTGNATYVLATLSLPAGTWALVGHLNGVNNTATSQRLDCFFTGTPDENDLAKFRAQPNTADQVIYADLSLQVVTTLPSATTVKVECAPTGTSPDWTFNSVKLTAVQATGVTRQ